MCYNQTSGLICLFMWGYAVRANCSVCSTLCLRKMKLKCWVFFYFEEYVAISQKQKNCRKYWKRNIKRKKKKEQMQSTVQKKKKEQKGERNRGQIPAYSMRKGGRSMMWLQPDGSGSQGKVT